MDRRHDYWPGTSLRLPRGIKLCERPIIIDGGQLSREHCPKSNIIIIITIKDAHTNCFLRVCRSDNHLICQRKTMQNFKTFPLQVNILIRKYQTNQIQRKELQNHWDSNTTPPNHKACTLPQHHSDQCKKYTGKIN